MTARSPATVELRCPEGMGKLLAKAVSGKPPLNVVDGWLVEVACSNCRRALRGSDVVQVVHRFNVLGQLIETQAVRSDGAGETLPGLQREQAPR